MAIYFHAEEINYQLRGKKEIRNWICRVIEIEEKQTGDLNIIFTSDSYLLKINKQYLNRNYYTDIITFNYGDGVIVSGDLYISMERVKENARAFNITLRKELMRIIIHGILHLIGYDDSNDAERKSMTEKEDKYINLVTGER